MDFLIVSVAILIITLFARFFFKTMLFVSVVGILTYVFVPQNIKNKMDEIVSLQRVQIIVNSTVNSLFTLSKNTAKKIDKEAKEFQKK